MVGSGVGQTDRTLDKGVGVPLDEAVDAGRVSLA